MDGTAFLMDSEALSFKKKDIPKKYQNTAVAVYQTKAEAYELAQVLTKETGIEHCVDIDKKEEMQLPMQNLLLML